MSENSQATIDVFSRLTNNVIPVNYLLTLRPDFNSFKFYGQVEISIEIKEERSFIELHSVELDIQKVEWVSSESNGIKIKHDCQMSLIKIDFQLNKKENPFDRIETNKRNESVRIHFKNTFPIGIGKLQIEYIGILNENLQGFYKTKCLNRDATMGYAAVTQFEPAYARRAFPCFDEPVFKATFDVIIIAERDKTVLSNMPLKAKTRFDDILDCFHFETSPIMSTYLLAFVIGHYDFVETKNKFNTLVRIYTPVGKAKLGHFSLNLTAKVLEFFTRYFGLEYPLPKLDLIGLGDIDIEAMENWGLITFKESLVLIDLDNYSVQTKFEVALTVSHEIAHQWFGNIVTMEWWKDLWLNEGFATWVEYLAVDYTFPEWNIWNYYATDHLYRAFNLDGLKSSHPIEVPVGPPSEVFQIFDSISYCKGSAIIRMVNNFVGSDIFVKGLNQYLSKYKYKNASTSDLWDELDYVSNKNVKDLMQVWTKEAGYPLVYVNKRIDQSGHTILELKQEKYLRISSMDDETLKWNIPISILTKSSHPNIHSTIFMTEKAIEVDIGCLNQSDWIKLNQNNVDFFRVKYSQQLFESILDGLNDPIRFASSMDRNQLLNDAFDLAWSNHLSAYDLLRLVWKFRNETDTHVWTMLIRHLHALGSCLISRPAWPKFKQFILSLYKTLGDRLNPDEISLKDDVSRQLYGNIFYALAKFDDKKFKEYATIAYTNRRTMSIPADMQKAVIFMYHYHYLSHILESLKIIGKKVFTSILRNGEEKTVDEFIEMYKMCELPEEKERIAIILSEVCDIGLIEKVLRFALSCEVTMEECAFIIVGIAQNTSQNSLDLAWDFIKNNWDLIYSRYSDSVLLGRILKPVIQSFCTLQSLEEIKSFFARNIATQAEFSINQGIEIIESNICFLEHQETKIESFLNEFGF